MIHQIPSELASLSHACVVLQEMPGAIQRAASELGIAPVVMIDGRPHFAAADVNRIRDHLAGDRGPILPE